MPATVLNRDRLTDQRGQPALSDRSDAPLPIERLSALTKDSGILDKVRNEAGIGSKRHPTDAAVGIRGCRWTC